MPATKEWPFSKDAKEWPIDGQESVPEREAPVTDMRTFYIMVLVVLVLSCSLVIGADLYRKCKNELPKDARNLQAIFLLGYLLCAAADWLQGPYIYALYAAYGFSSFQLAVLFVTGFSAAMIFGPAVGAFADRFGRKRCIVLLYCFTYTASCVTKHFNVFWILILGRVLGGIATSALFSAFESWLVGEATKRGLAQTSLDAVFSNMYFANGLMAILMGMLAEFAAGIRAMSQKDDFAVGGYLAPFYLSLTLCLLAALIIGRAWGENKPEVSNPANGRYFEQIFYAFRVLMGDRLLMLLMMVSSLIEASMYAFIFEWTPALTTEGRSPPLGIIFSCFMLAYMIGSCAFSIIMRGTCQKGGLEPVTMLVAITALAIVALTVPWVLHASGYASTDRGEALCFLGFLVYEAIIGVYMPLFASIKARYVPEEVRASVYTIFRIPLNMIVVVVLLVNLSLGGTFMLCVLLLSAALACALTLRVTIRHREVNSVLNAAEGAPSPPRPREADGLLSAKGV